MSDIKPCPFCGNPGEITQPHSGPISYIYYVKCSGCSAHGPDAASTVEAIAKWNARVPEQSPTKGGGIKFKPQIKHKPPPELEPELTIPEFHPGVNTPIQISFQPVNVYGGPNDMPTYQNYLPVDRYTGRKLDKVKSFTIENKANELPTLTLQLYLDKIEIEPDD